MNDLESIFASIEEQELLDNDEVDCMFYNQLSILKNTFDNDSINEIDEEEIELLCESLA